MTLRETIVSDASTVFCNEDDFAESVVYRYGTAGSEVTISAVVTREGLQEVDGINQTEYFEISFAVSSVSPDDITTKKDAIRFARRVGETASWRTVQRIISHDEGMVVVECR